MPGAVRHVVWVFTLVAACSNEEPQAPVFDSNTAEAEPTPTHGESSEASGETVEPTATPSPTPEQDDETPQPTATPTPTPTPTPPPTKRWVSLISNYEGGAFVVQVDDGFAASEGELYIGITAYDPTQLTVTGSAAALARVAEFHVVQLNLATTVGGIPEERVVIRSMPPSPLSDPAGSPSIICTYPGAGGGGCNTPAQVEAYHLQEAATPTIPTPTLIEHKMQYPFYSGVQTLQCPPS